MKLLAISMMSLIIWSGACEALATQEGPEKTLSPYFLLANSGAGGQQFPLQATRVEVTINGVIAHVTVCQQYTNQGKAPVNGSYIFPGSTRSAVHALKMTIGQRVVYATIKEKEVARKLFTKAQKQGKTASLLEQHRPNVFSMEVGNILPGDTIEIELQYTELLVPTAGRYSFVYPTVVGPRYSSLREADSHPAEQWASNPYLLEENPQQPTFDINVLLAAGMPVLKISTPSHASRIDFENDSLVRVRLAATESLGGNRDYVLHYRLADDRIATGLLLHKGDKENFFLCMLQPPLQVQPETMPAREYLFVVDVSGSMHGFPLNTAKLLMQDLLSGLTAKDSFNVLLFAGGSRLMAPESVPANGQNINKASRMLNNERGGGGTELFQALQQTLQLPADPGRSRTILVITDGYISAEQEVFTAIQDNLDQVNVFSFGIGSSVNRFLIKGIARSGHGEAFIVTAPEQAPAMADRFRNYVSSPVLTDIGLAFNDFEAYAVEPVAIPDLFASRPILVFGKWRGQPRGTIEITGTGGDGQFHQTMPVTDIGHATDFPGLPYLWARQRLTRLSDYSRHANDPEQRQEIVTLGLTYNLLTRYTSFVAIDDLIRHPGGAKEDVRQPLPLPRGVSNLAVGYSVNKVPEPELSLLLVLLASLLGFAYLRRLKSGK